MRGTRGKSRRPRRNAWATVLIVALIAALIVKGANIFEVWVPGIGRIAMAVEAAVIGFYLLRCAMTGRPEVAMAGLGVLGVLLGETVLFALISGSAPNFDIVFAFLPLVTFVPFIAYENGLEDLLRLMVMLIAGYLVVYVFAQAVVLHDGAGAANAVLRGDGDRGDRVYLLLPAASFAAFAALESRRSGFPTRAALLILALAALWISGSRTFQLLFLLVFVLALVRALGRATRIALFGVFAVVVGAMLAGFALPEWNPFSLMAWDSSGAGRMQEYRLAVDALHSHWITGIGLPGDDADMQRFLRTPRYEPLYPTDIGAMGPMLLFGAPGLAAFVGMVWFCMASAIRRTESGAARAVRLNGVLCGLYGIISPTLMLESGAIVLSLLIAMRVLAAETQGGEASAAPSAQLDGQRVAHQGEPGHP